MSREKNEKGQNRRSGLQIMGQLIGLVKPLLPIMLIAIFLGVIGYLCAIFLTIFAGYALIHEVLVLAGVAILPGRTDFLTTLAPKQIFVCLVIMAVLRGVLHYGEQYCNHFIAFKLLAIIRHKCIAGSSKAVPGQTRRRYKGNLFQIITSDIELLEVFYAHTISPIAIAVVTSVIMVLFIGHCSLVAGVVALVGYIVVGRSDSIIHCKKGAASGMEFRSAFGDLNSFILDSLRGLDETIQYGGGKKRMQAMDERSKELGEMQKELNRLEASQRSVTNMVILLFSFGMLFLMLHYYVNGAVGFEHMLIAVIAMMGSFGPTVALSNLSNNLNQTLQR